MKFAWSFSALSTYRQCAKKYFHLRVAKDVKDDDSQFAGEGKLIHDALKKRVIGDVALPIELRHLEKMAAKLANARGEKRGELQLAINADFEPVDWFAKDAWCRAIIDLLILPKPDTALIIDYKTGKRKDEFEQLKLCAAVLSAFMPEIEHFKLVYLWTKSRQMTPPLVMEKHHMQGVWSDVMPQLDEIAAAMRTTSFPATQSPLCGWCPVKQCPHHP